LLPVLVESEFRASKTGSSVSLAKKKIEICREADNAELNLSNEYGNALRYELSANQFDSLLAALWQFVKERH
ncbi:MAG: hypothetical protein ACRD99_03900, partial [Nitrososphaera sp.]